MFKHAFMPYINGKDYGGSGQGTTSKFGETGATLIGGAVGAIAELASIGSGQDAQKNAALREADAKKQAAAQTAASTQNTGGQGREQAQNAAQNQVQTEMADHSQNQAKEQSADLEAQTETVDQRQEQNVELTPEQIKENEKEIRKLLEEAGIEIVETEKMENVEQNSDNSQNTAQPFQRVPWEELSPEMQEEIAKAILKHADINDDMGYGVFRGDEGPEAFVRAFYEDYFREDLAEWDAPSVDIQDLARRLDEIQGIGINEEQENVGSKKGVENSEISDIFDVIGNEQIPITDAAIENVREVSPFTWSEEQAEILQRAHRELLRSVQNAPVGAEASFLIDEAGNILAQRENVAGHVDMPRLAEKHIMMHNHPDNQVFSHTDINSFLDRESTIAMSAVGNDGSVFLLIKTDTFDRDAACLVYAAAEPEIIRLKNTKNYDGYIEAIYQVIWGLEQHGIEFVCETT